MYLPDRAALYNLPHNRGKHHHSNKGGTMKQCLLITGLILAMTAANSFAACEHVHIDSIDYPEKLLEMYYDEGENHNGLCQEEILVLLPDVVEKFGIGIDTLSNDSWIYEMIEAGLDTSVIYRGQIVTITAAVIGVLQIESYTGRMIGLYEFCRDAGGHRGVDATSILLSIGRLASEGAKAYLLEIIQTSKSWGLLGTAVDAIGLTKDPAFIPHLEVLQDSMRKFEHDSEARSLISEIKHTIIYLEKYKNPVIGNYRGTGAAIVQPYRTKRSVRTGHTSRRTTSGVLLNGRYAGNIRAGGVFIARVPLKP